MTVADVRSRSQQDDEPSSIDQVPMESPDRASGLYLDLLKRCLIDSIYVGDPLSDYMFFREKPYTAKWKRLGIRAVQALLRRYGLKVVEPHWVPWMHEYAKLDPEEKRERRERGFGWPLRAHTFLSLDRLDNIQYCVETVMRDDVPGNLIKPAYGGAAHAS